MGAERERAERVPNGCVDAAPGVAYSGTPEFKTSAVYTRAHLRRRVEVDTEGNNVVQNVETMSLSELGARLRALELSPVELVERSLARIERYDGVLRSHISVFADRARGQARQAEREIAAGAWRGPLHGVPYGVKDQLHTQGDRTTLGSRVLADAVSSETATTVARLEDAGAILIGKHNLHELGKGGTVEFPFGYPRNPWHLQASSSSSSNGSGVAVAAGLNAFALGEDTGGSIRGPAAAMNLVGLRPTFGRVSRHGGVMYGWMADTIGPLTRTVADAAIVLGVIAGHDPLDPLTSRAPVPDYLAALGDDVRGLRIGLVPELTWVDGLHPAVERAMRQAIEVFESAGVRVEEVSLPTTRRTSALTSATTDVDVAAVVMQRFLRDRWDDLDIATRTRMAAAALVPGALQSRAMRMRALLRREVLGALERYDALLSPANLAPPPWLDGRREEQAAGDRSSVVRAAAPSRHTARPFAIANTPTIAVPAGFSDDGRPVSLQLAGRRLDEATVFRLAAAYEHATDWHQRVPDLDRTIADDSRGATP